MRGAKAPGLGTQRRFEVKAKAASPSPMARRSSNRAPSAALTLQQPTSKQTFLGSCHQWRRQRRRR